MKKSPFLKAAEEVNAYVEGKMLLGASNKAGDVFSSFGGSMLCVVASRSVEVSMPKGTIPAWLREAAAKAEATGCGNCGEQAAIAFIQLAQRKIVPLDYMARNHADHAFVVIGRARGSRAEIHTTWGPEAIVCDPWDGKAYPAADIPTKMYGGAPFSPTSVFRLER